MLVCPKLTWRQQLVVHSSFFAVMYHYTYYTVLMLCVNFGVVSSSQYAVMSVRIVWTEWMLYTADTTATPCPDISLALRLLTNTAIDSRQTPWSGEKLFIPVFLLCRAILTVPIKFQALDISLFDFQSAHFNPVIYFVQNISLFFHYFSAALHLQVRCRYWRTCTRCNCNPTHRDWLYSQFYESKNVSQNLESMWISL